MAAMVHFVCLHSRTLKEAAQILEMDEKTLRKLRRELGVEWTRPMKRFAPTSSPPEWWRELMQFLRSYDDKYPLESIANLTNLSEEFVLSIQNRLVKEGKLLCLKKGKKVIRKRI